MVLGGDEGLGWPLNIRVIQKNVKCKNASMNTNDRNSKNLLHDSNSNNELLRTWLSFTPGLIKLKENKEATTEGHLRWGEGQFDVERYCNFLTKKK